MLPYGSQPWFEAWVDAAYGPAGFWTREQPGAHFRTGSATGDGVASAVAALLDRAPRIRTVVDVGAGDGALLAGLAAVRPELRLVAVDRRPRPPGLHDRVGWHQDHWDVRTSRWTAGGPDGWLGPSPGPALLMAHEWLDDLPAPVVEGRVEGWAEVWVSSDGTESPGRPAGPGATAWATRWWPEGRRAELGLTRDAAWAGLVAAALGTGGWALAVDYGHTATDRPPTGSLAAYADGRRHRPRPDGTVNLTAHVAVDSLVAAGERVGAATLLQDRQHAVLDAWAATPAEPDPLRRLEARSRRAALAAPEHGGDLWWLLQGPHSSGFVA